MLPVIAGTLGGAALGGLIGHFNRCSTGACPLLATWWRGALYGGVMGLLMSLAAFARA